jgi:uncharacterized protein YaaW (UPF0174 family)
LVATENKLKLPSSQRSGENFMNEPLGVSLESDSLQKGKEMFPEIEVSSLKEKNLLGMK